MDKPKKFGIYAVRYSEEPRHIVKVRMLDMGEGFKTSNPIPMNPQDYTREQVIGGIKNNHTFITIFKDVNGWWEDGQPVQIITVNKKEWLFSQIVLVAHILSHW